MLRTVLAVAILAGVPALAHADASAAPLIVTATVVSTCSVDVPRSAEASTFATFLVTVTCARRGTTPRVERPIPPPPRSEVREAVLVIDF